MNGSLISAIVNSPYHLIRAFDRASIVRWQHLVRQVESQSKRLSQLSDDELRKRSLALQYDALSGVPLHRLAVEAFACVREAASRTLGMKHYRVQLLGGFAMHFGSIAVMQTGEGKTLTATLPLYLAAITGEGAHLATANDYLAKRDADLMRPVFEALGMSVGVVESKTPRHLRPNHYQCDVTYSTAKEIGFDFLRDRLTKRRNQNESGSLIHNLVDRDTKTISHSSNATVQRPLNFMLVDEADSILIDEARTPLIVSSLPDEVARARACLYEWCAANVEQFSAEEHYTIDTKTNQVDLTATGRQRCRTLSKPELLCQTPLLDVYEQVEQAVFVQLNYIRDRQYVVRDQEVVIVDEFTGRLAEGRKWRAGIHQAIEARENLEVSLETGESARITIQDLFLRYNRLAGMTGTAANSAIELRKIYQLKVIDVPTNKPPQRKQWDDLVFLTDTEKWDAIADEIQTVHQQGRPILIGTRSIDKSEILSKLLHERSIEHAVLNARHLAREASIVAEAGDVGKITVATNMAGRGTDIKISEDAHRFGGMHVICTEIHDSSRIDRQLIGRCGRQGDPGSYRQFFSLEDEILDNGLGKERADRLREKIKRQGARDLSRFAQLFREAQRKIESRHFRGRKMLLHQEKLRHELQREMGQDPYLDTIQ
ncbi:MAG: helicase-related protein [Planctomycetota bacterium]